MASIVTVRNAILTGGVTAIVATGTIFGAQLKGTQETIKHHQEIKRTSPDELIESLQTRIGKLQETRAGLQKKISDVEAKIHDEAIQKNKS